MSVEGLGDPLTRAVDPDVLLARAYLSRVVEPPGTAVVRWLSDKDPREAAASVRAGSVPDDVADQVRARREVDQAAEDLAILDACGGRLIVPESPEWPSLAFRAFSPRVPSGAVADERTTAPIALWARGPAAPVDAERRAVAVVGARAATDYGAWVARHWSAGLADRGLRVVSGAALGIDGVAHRGALSVGGVTVAVLACGIDRPYPPRNAGLIDHIARTGLVLTEYPPGAVPARYRFLVRNRLIAALAEGTLVVEAAARSGALSTARAAQLLGRVVMAVPGPVSSAQSVGCHILARDEGVRLVGRVDEVVEDVGRMGDDLAPRPWRPRRPTDDLDTEALRVHEALSCHRAQGVVRLAHESGVDPTRITTHLRDLVDGGLAEPDKSGWRRRGG